MNVDLIFIVGVNEVFNEQNWLKIVYANEKYIGFSDEFETQSRLNK